MGNLFDFSNKKFLITGAGSGIGKATSILLSELGAELLLVDVNDIALDGTIKKCKTHIKKVVLDLRELESSTVFIKNNITEFGKLDGIIHSAGISYISPLKFISLDKANDVFLINTYAAIELAKIFSDKNISNGCGSIVFISSIYGCVGSVANSAYAMSKSALHGITKSLAIELASKKIRVNCIAPGFIDSEMLKTTSENFGDDYYQNISNMHPLGLGKPEDVANTILFLLSDMSKWITGSIINVDGGYTAQ